MRAAYRYLSVVNARSQRPKRQIDSVGQHYVERNIAMNQSSANDPRRYGVAHLRVSLGFHLSRPAPLFASIFILGQSLPSINAYEQRPCASSRKSARPLASTAALRGE